jgi:hypothetical protein
MNYRSGFECKQSFRVVKTVLRAERRWMKPSSMPVLDSDLRKVARLLEIVAPRLKLKRPCK